MAQTNPDEHTHIHQTEVVTTMTGFCMGGGGGGGGGAEKKQFIDNCEWLKIIMYIIMSE